VWLEEEEGLAHCIRYIITEKAKQIEIEIKS
jgi:hypothetical protein